MSDAPTKIVVDCSTGEQQIIELTAAEIAQRDQDAAAALADAEAREEAAAELAAGSTTTASSSPCLCTACMEP
jgi:hypothetical protein